MRFRLFNLLWILSVIANALWLISGLFYIINGILGIVLYMMAKKNDHKYKNFYFIIIIPWLVIGFYLLILGIF